MEIIHKIVYSLPIRVSEFQVNVIKELPGGDKIVVYEAKEPAEIYTLPNSNYRKADIKWY